MIFPFVAQKVKCVQINMTERLWNPDNNHGPECVRHKTKKNDLYTTELNTNLSFLTQFQNCAETFFKKYPVQHWTTCHKNWEKQKGLIDKILQLYCSFTVTLKSDLLLRLEIVAWNFIVPCTDTLRVNHHCPNLFFFCRLLNPIKITSN